jgi:hypothetical protein
MAAGWLLACRLFRLAAEERATVAWGPLLGAAALAGPVAACCSARAAASGGPLGGGRLAEIGPVAWQVAAVATAVVAVGAMLGAAAAKSFAPTPAARTPAVRS